MRLICHTSVSDAEAGREEQHARELEQGQRERTSANTGLEQRPHLAGLEQKAKAEVIDAAVVADDGEVLGLGPLREGTDEVLGDAAEAEAADQPVGNVSARAGKVRRPLRLRCRRECARTECFRQECPSPRPQLRQRPCWRTCWPERSPAALLVSAASTCDLPNLSCLRAKRRTRGWRGRALAELREQRERNISESAALHAEERSLLPRWEAAEAIQGTSVGN